MEHNFYFATDASRGLSSEWLMLAENIKIKQCCENRGGSFVFLADLISICEYFARTNMDIFSAVCLLFLQTKYFWNLVKDPRIFGNRRVVSLQYQESWSWKEGEVDKLGYKYCLRFKKDSQFYSPGRPIGRVWVPFWRWFCPCCLRRVVLICCNCWANHRKAAWRPGWAGPRPGRDRGGAGAINAAGPHPSFSC